MKCENCNVSVFDKPLHRTKPTGQPDGGWMCQDCIQNQEPELYNNIEDDGDFNLVNDIFDAVQDTPTDAKHVLADSAFSQEEENELQRLVRKIKYMQPTHADLVKADELTRKKWKSQGIGYHFR